MVDGFRAADDPDVTVRLDPAAEATAHGLSLDEVASAEDYVGWDLHFGARITFSDDMQFYDGRGLHYLLSVGPDMPRGGMVIKTVTPEQLQEYARSLLRLANRAAARRAVVVIDGQLEIGDFIAEPSS